MKPFQKALKHFILKCTKRTAENTCSLFSLRTEVWMDNAAFLLAAVLNGQIGHQISINTKIVARQGVEDPASPFVFRP